MAKKPSLGRQKIKIAKIQVKNHLQVTFSKRRSGLFKKASELCTLCGVEIAIVVFSPAGNVFSFGHPKVEPIIDRYLSGNLNLGSSRLTLAESHRMASSIPDLNMQLTYMLNELEAQKKTGETLDEMRKGNQKQFWWEAPTENLNLLQLEQLEDSMEKLKKTVDIISQANNKMVLVESCNSKPFLGANKSISGDANQQYHDQMKTAFNISSSSSTVPAAAGSHQAYSYGYGNGNGYGYGYGNGNENDNGYGFRYGNDNGYGYGNGHGLL